MKWRPVWKDYFFFFIPPQATNSLKKHQSISVYTKGLINDLANPALNAEPHHNNLINQQGLRRL